MKSDVITEQKKTGRLLAVTSYRSYLMLLVCLFVSTSSLFSSPKVEIDIPVKNLAENEKGKINFYCYDYDPSNMDQLLELADYTLTLKSKHITITNDRRNCYVYSYTIESLTAGVYTLPSIEFELANQSFVTPTQSFYVHKLSDFDKKSVKIGDNELNYYSKTFLSKSEAYVNEAIRAEVRYIIPRKANIYEWGVTNLLNNPKISAWRFERPTPLNRRTGYQTELTALHLDHSGYVGGSYQTTLHGTAAGTTDFGPVSASLVLYTTYLDNFGRSRGVQERVDFAANASSLLLKTLPENAPSSFTGSVGHFKLKTFPLETKELSLEESLKCKIAIEGTGNFQSISAPLLQSPEAWEVIDTSKSDTKEARKKLTGSVSFDYLISPKKIVPHSPILEFSYFDPTSESYKTLITESTPLRITRASNLGGSISLNSKENQQTVLGFISSDQYQRAFKLPFSWHFIPLGILGMIIALWVVRMRKQYKLDHTEKYLKQSDLAALKDSKLSAIEFYKAAGRFVEKWLPEKQDKRLDALLKERDEQCFLPETEQDKVQLDYSKRAEYIKLLKSFFLIILCFSLIQKVEAGYHLMEAEHAIAAKNYQKAIDEYEKATVTQPYQYYNVGNCYYHLNQPGMAALHYYKALVLDPEHPESLQNLKFLSPDKDKQEKQKWSTQQIVKLNQSVYRTIFEISLWLIALFAVSLLLLKPKRKLLLLHIIVPIFALCIAIISFTCIQLYPKSLYFAPLKELAVVTKTGFDLRTEPISAVSDTNDTSHIVNLTETSLCKILQTRASWSYIELASGTRGWVKSEAVTEIFK